MSAKWLDGDVGIIDTHGYGAEGTVAVYLVRGERSSALIDVGYSSNWSTVEEGIAQLGVPLNNVTNVFLTHFHLDHAGSTWNALKTLPNAKVIVHERAMRHLIEPSRIVDAARAAFGSISSEIGDLKPIQPERLEPAKEEPYDLGGITVRPVFTPGHLSSHMSMYTSNGDLFAGDAVCVRRDKFLVPAGSPPIFDVASAVKSLETLKSLRPKRVYAPHFGPYDASAQEFDLHVRTIQSWYDSISSLVGEGLDLNGIFRIVRESVLKQAGRELTVTDEFERRVLLDSLLKMTVEGYVGYVLAGKMYAGSVNTITGIR